MLFTLGVTLGCGYAFAPTALAGAFLPFRAKALYEPSPGAQFKVNGWLGLLLMAVGLVTFAWSTCSMAVVFATQWPLLWLVRLLALAGVAWVVYALREHLPRWAGGAEMPWLTVVA